MATRHPEPSFAISFTSFPLFIMIRPSSLGCQLWAASCSLASQWPPSMNTNLRRHLFVLWSILLARSWLILLCSFFHIFWFHCLLAFRAGDSFIVRFVLASFWLLVLCRRKMWKNGRISVDHRIDKRSTCDAHYPISAAAIGRLLFPFLLSSSRWHTFHHFLLLTAASLNWICSSWQPSFPENTFIYLDQALFFVR